MKQRQYFRVKTDDGYFACEADTFRMIKRFTSEKKCLDFIKLQNKYERGFEGLTPMFFTKPMSIRFNG